MSPFLLSLSQYSVDVREIWLLQAVSMEKERLKRDLTDNEDSIKTLQASLKKQADDCSEKQEALGGII
jgi:hypothetical protein